MGTPHENTFLCILRHFLRLDNTNKMTSVIWEVIEKLICRATVLDRDEFKIEGTLERYTQEKFMNKLFETKKQEAIANEEGEIKFFNFFQNYNYSL